MSSGVKQDPLLNFVDGLDEVDLYHKNEFKKIENSTNKKANLIADYLTASFKNKLKVSKGGKKWSRLKKVIVITASAAAIIITILVGGIQIYKWIAGS
jgi:hypothetical protein